MKKQILLATTLVAFINTTTSADIYGVENVSGGSLNFATAGFVDFNDREGSPNTIEASASIQIDWASQSARFDRVSFSFSGDSYTRTRSYTTGPGQTKTITASVHLDPFTLEATNLGTFDITPANGGLYNVDRSMIGPWGPLALTGHVDVTGPTGSESAPFTISLLPNYTVFASLKTIGTTDYPESIQLNFYDNSSTWIGNWYHGTQTTLIDTSVDGIDVNVTTTSSNGGAIAYTSGPIELQAIPEPSSLALIFIASISGVFIRRRLRR